MSEYFGFACTASVDFGTPVFNGNRFSEVYELSGYMEIDISFFVSAFPMEHPVLIDGGGHGVFP